MVGPFRFSFICSARFAIVSGSALIAAFVSLGVSAEPAQSANGKATVTLPAAPRPPASQLPAGVDGEESEPKLSLKKLKAEVEKLQLEVEDLRSPGAVRIWLPAIGPLITALMTGALALVAYKLNRTQVAKLKQDNAQGRREHLLKLFQELGDKDPKIRLGAVAVLLQRLEEMKSPTSDDVAEKQDQITIICVLIAVTKYETEVGIQKQIGDGLARTLSARIEVEKQLRAASPLKDDNYDFQGAQFGDVYWRFVDARNVDFFKANLTQASLKQAHLQKAIFRNAILIQTVLEGANLEGANLDGANLEHARLGGANLRGAKLRGANLSAANLDPADPNAGSSDLANPEAAKLRKSNFIKTCLIGADLSGANLSHADFAHADLSSANLTGATVDGANFQGATQVGMILTGAKDVLKAKGLDAKAAFNGESQSSTVETSEIRSAT
jgi:uncharacterized protein YjbI with pentapeptide repeats